ncbi:MAG: hypothetical protein KGJ11_09915 [Candidatus Omnitrophica bacterium]|nr:hypothetical protein [Candidatus Omnitrophota bacterium]
MKKWIPLLRFLAVSMVVVFILSEAKDFLIKTSVDIASPKIIGAKVEIGSLSVGLLSHKIIIKNFRMYNPPGFPKQVFLVMPEVMVDVDVPQLLKGKMHFPYVVFNMDKVIIIKNKERKLNVDSLKIVEEQQAANKGKPMKLPVFKIDTLDLNLGKVIVEDYTHAPPVRVLAYDVGVKNLKIRNINGIPKLVTIVLVEAMKPTALRSAGLYAATAVLGVGFFPAVAIGLAVAKDTADADLNTSSSRVHRECLRLIADLKGTVKKTDEGKGEIWAKVYNCDITFTIQSKGWERCHIKIKARQFMLPKLETANGLLYQLTERLK